jgi:hypothetical protein
VSKVNAPACGQKVNYTTAAGHIFQIKSICADHLWQRVHAGFGLLLDKKLAKKSKIEGNRRK